MYCIHKTYVIHERSIQDVEEFMIYLNQIRGLLHIQFERIEEEVLTESLQLVRRLRSVFLLRLLYVILV